MEKPEPYGPSLPHIVAINGFQGLLSSITSVPSYPPQGEGICLALPPPGIRASSYQQMTCKTPAHSLYPGYKSGLRIPAQRPFSLELPTVLTVSPSLINYFPLILSHVWTFFSNLCLDHDTEYNYK